ncbi:MAG: PqqD family protein [Sphingomonas sp.]|uniref:PqqD family protein n=1 Tax=Sphingomonas sp. TaxID=28214 RepID=UPI003F7F58DB
MSIAVEQIRFAPAPTLSWNDVGDELTLFDTATGQYFALNGGAVAIWRELAAGRNAVEAAASLAMRFDSPRGEIMADIAAFLHAALDRDLLIARE